MTNRDQSHRPTSHAEAAMDQNEKTFRKAVQLAESGALDQALHHLARAASTEQIRNARAVCLMRSGSLPAAVETLRSVVLRSGTVQLRDDVPLIYQTNFCTALLLSGRPGGCWDVLAEIRNQQHPSVIRLRTALKNWEKRLSILQRINWKLGIAPEVSVNIDFIPGEFLDPLSATPPRQNLNTDGDPKSPRNAA
ncbi:MAG: hypothetical protein KDA85_19160 [Planctomycetaceae bacterium]|nr:hypothetical protein [Planctomycetaceae bacterium]